MAAQTGLSILEWVGIIISASSAIAAIASAIAATQAFKAAREALDLSNSIQHIQFKSDIVIDDINCEFDRADSFSITPRLENIGSSEAIDVEISCGNEFFEIGRFVRDLGSFSVDSRDPLSRKHRIPAKSEKSFKGIRLPFAESYRYVIPSGEFVHFVYVQLAWKDLTGFSYQVREIWMQRGPIPVDPKVHDFQKVWSDRAVSGAYQKLIQSKPISKDEFGSTAFPSIREMIHGVPIA